MNGDIRLDVRGPRLDRLDGRARIRLFDSRYRALRTRRLAGSAELAAGRFEIDLEGELGPARVAVDGWLRAFDSVPTYALGARVAGAPENEKSVWLDRLLGGRRAAAAPPGDWSRARPGPGRSSRRRHGGPPSGSPGVLDSAGQGSSGRRQVRVERARWRDRWRPRAPGQGKLGRSRSIGSRGRSARASTWPLCSATARRGAGGGHVLPGGARHTTTEHAGTRPRLRRWVLRIASAGEDPPRSADDGRECPTHRACVRGRGLGGAGRDRAALRPGAGTHRPESALSSPRRRPPRPPLRSWHRPHRHGHSPGARAQARRAAAERRAAPRALTAGANASTAQPLPARSPAATSIFD